MKPSQKDRVLAALSKAGERGITRVDFQLPYVIDGGDPILNFPARIKELKLDGWDVQEGGWRNKCKVARLTNLDRDLDSTPSLAGRGAVGADPGEDPPSSPGTISNPSEDGASHPASPEMVPQLLFEDEPDDVRTSVRTPAMYRDAA